MTIGLNIALIFSMPRYLDKIAILCYLCWFIIGLFVPVMRRFP
jgi:hypothetical protein